MPCFVDSSFRVRLNFVKAISKFANTLCHHGLVTLQNGLWLASKSDGNSLVQYSTSKKLRHNSHFYPVALDIHSR